VWAFQIIMDKLLSFLKSHLFFVLFIITTAIISTALSKYWGPYDEGIVTVAAERLLNGEVPYKDFFIIMYPPGQVFILAVLYKLFGVSIEIGRMYTGGVQVVIAMTSFLICRALTGKTWISVCVWAFIVTCLSPRMGAIPAPIWPGVACALVAIYLFSIFVRTGRFHMLMYSGFLAGVSTVFRHDIGLFAVLAIIAGCILYRCSIRYEMLFLASWFVLPSVFLIYLFINSALPDMIDSLILFPMIHKESAGIAFPRPCFDLIMIFHQSLYFIKCNQYYIPLLVYGFISLYIIHEFLRNRRLDKNGVIVSVLLVFGILSFNQVRIRTDPAHLLTVIYPAVILFGFMLSRTWGIRPKNIGVRYARAGYVILIAFLFTLLTVKNTDKYFKNVFRKPMKGKIAIASFERGSVYIPVDERDGIMNVVSFIRDKTAEGEYIFVGNYSHAVDAFGGNLILYTLCGRLPSTKYYEFAPVLITRKYVQEEMMRSLKEKGVRYLVLQDIDMPDITDLSDGRSRILDNYIKKHYILVKKFGKCGIYEKTDIH